jgi:hypothetical protein
MSPEEELKKLNTLIRQYETVFRTATDEGQRGRVAKELKRLMNYREKILAVNVIDQTQAEEKPQEIDDLAEYPILKRLTEEDLKAKAARAAEAREPEEDRNDLPTTQMEVTRIRLYTDHFSSEFIPFLTEMRLKLDFKFSMERDSFYGRFQDLERKIADYRDEIRRLNEGTFTKEIETDIKKRAFKLKRILEAEASRFFRAIKNFAAELVEDARADGVKCLNGEAAIVFDKIEGKRSLTGRKVSEALEEIQKYADEVISYLNIPEIESQEYERADRH